MRTIVLTGGGTAGHVLPHFALLPYLEKHFTRIVYIGRTQGTERDLVQKKNIEYHGITSAKLRRSFDLRNLSVPFKLLKGINEAKRLLREIRPDAVFSKGGFVAYPVVRAAAKLGIPVIAHESDMTMGLANRLSAKYCKSICTTFARTAKNGGKFIHTGSPIRANIYKGNKAAVQLLFPSLRAARNLLVVGGSQGAKNINTAVVAALPELTEKYNIIHLCGQGKKGEGGNSTPLNYVQLEYADNIADFYAWADVVVSRAGSNALCELVALKKPTLFIPLSRAASRGDQIENAEFTARQAAASVLSEDDLTPKNLVAAINETYANRETYAQNAAKLNLDGTQEIAEVIIKNC